MTRHLRELLVATCVATYALILLGIYTAAMGAGLTCDARWPLCDGAVFGLFPANWPSFIEWFHRLVAMITGFMILGSAFWVWRASDDRRIHVLMGVAAVLLPVQVWLGAETVLTYTILSLTGHFVVALLIFGAIVLSTLWFINPKVAIIPRIRYALGGVLVVHPIFLLLAPRVLFVHTGRVQVLYYGIGLSLIATLLIVGAWARTLRRTNPRFDHVGILSWIGSVLIGGQLLIGRLVYTIELQLIDTVATAITFGLLGVAAWFAFRAKPSPSLDPPFEGAIDG